MKKKNAAYNHLDSKQKNQQKGHFEKNRKKEGGPLKTLKKKGDTFQNPKYLVR